METLPAARILLVPEVLPPRRAPAVEEATWSCAEYPPVEIAEPVGVLLDVYV